MSQFTDSMKRLKGSLVWGRCPNCKASLSSMKDKKLVMSVFQCPSCRIGLKLKRDSLIENVLFVGFFLFIGIAIYFSRLMNLSVLFPMVIIFGAYSMLKPKKWEAITKGPVCMQCHYDLYGLEEPTDCPECGQRLNDQLD